MAVSDDRKYTSEFVYQLLEGVKGKTLGEVDKSHQFARIILPILSSMCQNPHPMRVPLDNLYLRQDSHFSCIYLNNMSRTLRTSSPHSSVCGNAHTHAGFQSRIHRLRLREHYVSVVPRQTVRRVVAACSLFNPPFAVTISFNSDVFRNGIKWPVTSMHKASLDAVPIPIVSRTKMVA